MNLRAAVFTFLQSKTLLTNLIGTALYADIAPQGTNNTKPYIVYSCPDYAQGLHYGGAVSYAGLQFRFTIYAATPISREAVFQALRNILHGRVGYVISDGVVNINVQSSELLDCGDAYSGSPDAGELGTFEQDLTFLFRYHEAVPTLP